MKYRRKQQLTIILVLVAVISTISVGFAAFSSTLNISSSATVTPNSDDFNIVFSSSQYAITTRDDSGTLVSGTGTNGAIGGITNLYRKSASGLIAQFTEPGQSLSTTIYAHNIGEYDAYLTGITIESVDGAKQKVCTASSDASDSLVQSACEGISISVNVGGIDYQYGESISNHLLAKGSVEPVVITVTYAEGASRADGDFDIAFGDLSLDYSTVDNHKLIEFSVTTANGKQTYYAESNMTWEQWINSEYNTEGYICNDGKIYHPSRDDLYIVYSSTIDGETKKIAIYDTDVIDQSENYFLGIINSSSPIPV